MLPHLPVRYDHSFGRRCQFLQRRRLAPTSWQVACVWRMLANVKPIRRIVGHSTKFRAVSTQLGMCVCATTFEATSSQIWDGSAKSASFRPARGGSDQIWAGFGQVWARFGQAWGGGLGAFCSRFVRVSTTSRAQATPSRSSSSASSIFAAIDSERPCRSSHARRAAALEAMATTMTCG